MAVQVQSNMRGTDCFPRSDDVPTQSIESESTSKRFFGRWDFMALQSY